MFGSIRTAMKYGGSFLCMLAVIAGFVAPAQAAVSFSEFVKGTDLTGLLGQQNTIGFAYAGNKFVGSVYFGANNGQLYATDLDGTNVRKFGAPIPGASGEMYVSSSFNLGGFSSGDVYAGHQSSGNIYKVTNDGSSVTLLTSGLVGGVRSIAFDPYGMYGNNMIVATSTGNIYRVTSAGSATLLANVGEDAEGLSFAPQQFGPFALGTLVVASEGSGSLRAIGPTGTITSLGVTIPGAEMVSFVPLDLGVSGNPLEGFYAASYPNNVVKADASQFTSFVGDIIVTSETAHTLVQVEWNGTNFVTNFVSGFPGQPEDGIFVTADIIQLAVPEPEIYAMLGIGLGLMGWAGRRRKQQAAAA